MKHHRHNITLIFFVLCVITSFKAVAQVVNTISSIDFGQYDFSASYNIHIQLGTDGNAQLIGTGVVFNGGESAGQIRITSPDTGIIEVKCSTTAQLFDPTATTLTIENIEISVNTGVAFGSGDSCQGVGVGDSIAATIDMDAIPDPDVFIGGEIVIPSPITLPTDQQYSTTGSGTPIMLSIVVQ